MEIKKPYTEVKRFLWKNLPEFADQVPYLASQLLYSEYEIITFEVIKDNHIINNRLVDWLISVGCQENEIIYIHF